MLSLLTVILAFNYVDRFALGVVLQNIKVDLNVSDTQLGFLSGIAFTLFYAVAGLPIAQWADRGNRVSIIAITTALWSLGVVLCGTATSFLQLLAIRVTVAVGEAGCIPPAHSLIADWYERAERSRAVAHYMLGVPAALIVGYFAAGWLNQLYGWRITFICIGSPGLILAALAWRTVHEPRKNAPRDAVADVKPRLGVRESCLVLFANPAYRHLLISFSLWYLFGYGLQQWQPAFFLRSFHLETGIVGSWFAGVYAMGAVGVYLGGELAARYAAGKERLQLLACGVGFVLFAVFNACAYLAPTYRQSFFWLALGAFGGNMAQGPIYASLQTLIAPQMRAFSIALVYLFANLIGMGFGPLLVGAMSDAMQRELGDQSLRHALVVMCPGYVWAAYHLWRASRAFPADPLATQMTAEALMGSRATFSGHVPDDSLVRRKLSKALPRDEH